MANISRVLILGCTGLVGHGIAVYLIKNKFKVYGTLNNKRVKSINNNFKIFENINLLNKKSFNKIDKIIKSHNIQAIIHSAALIPNKVNYKREKFYEESIQINSLSFLKLYKISNDNKVKFLINISTPNVEHLKKEDFENHHNFYIFTKYLAELFLSNFPKSKTKTISLRIKSPYGYILNTKAVIPNFISKSKSNKRLNLSGNINKKQTFTFVEDIGSACEKVFKNNLSGVQNCMGTEALTIKDLGNIIQRIFSKKKISVTNDKVPVTKYFYKGNINNSRTKIIDGLLKISKVKKNFQIFK